jgi:DNA-binding Xre family transcriptional regulator
LSQYASFEKYLEGKYYNDIHRAITGLILKRGRNNSFYSYTVLDPSYFQVDDIHVKTVSFHSTDGNRIIFNAAVEADVILKGMGKRDYDADMNNPWYTVSFTGYLSDGLNMVTITGVDEYSADRFDKNTTLSKYLVPYLYAEDLEKEAEKFLNKYCRHALKEPMPIPLDELMLNMGLELYEAPLPDNIFGKTYFTEATVDVFNEDYEVVSQTIDPGTILLNPNIFFMRNIGSRNNTVVHECVHWDRHDKFFELQKLLNSDLSSLSCEVIEHKSQKDSGIDGALQWMEWQANALTPRILLPASTARKKLNEILLRLHIENPERSESDIMEEAIQELTDFFAVSKFAAKLRAIELGFTQAQGVWNYVNGEYLPSFSFKTIELKKDESYIIDTRNACFESSADNATMAALAKGDFIYVDSMFCINDEKYIVITGGGICTLTSYARQNVDECCLKFKQKFKINNGLGDAFYTQCSLSRDVDASTFCECNYIDDEDNQNVVKRAAELKRLKEEGFRIMDIYRSLPMSFAGTLDAHMKRLEKEDGRKMTNLELSLRTGLTDRYIQDLRKEEKNVSFGTVCAICIGLHLHPIFSNDLIQKSHNNYPMNEEGFFNRFLIERHYMDNLELCNQKLSELGYRIWGKEL